MTVRVLLADDQEIVRTALRLIIDRRAGLSVIGEASDGEQSVALAIELRPDVVLMDVRMPGITGVEAARRITTSWPGPGPAPRILMLTTFDLDEYVYAALRAGADGFLLKTSTPDQLAHAIRAAADGESVLAPSVTRRLVSTVTALPPALLPALSAPAPDDRSPTDLLSERELQVLVLIAQGLSNSRIAAALDLTEANVKSRVNRILTRLGLENRVQAALLAHRTGLHRP
ncbi:MULTISPECIES: response regulator transcription factor [unclassified Kitasatospora]|uniref:response regulator n=1 Tax=unclassified Kitasatospora TaxID=2633591 RepID=UPI00070A90AB|nr:MULTISPECIES: response regulator transcription factor [unclassified Kitasatospora]KQV17495.1 LuxR family transcriptional regulator [Kitasatospora sp. Root107]KRB69257.1 LuxR family transcriptional regulator [Kitasatospora sp. Root187]